MYELVFPVIEDLVVAYQRNPGENAEDTDLRKQLFSALYRKFSTANLAFRMPKASLDIGYYPERDTLALTPVKTAYPASEKFDIAVLDLTKTRPLEVEEAKSEARFKRYWEQSVAMAIQIHVCKHDQNPLKYLSKLTRDQKKFASYGESSAVDFGGMSLLFVEGDLPAAAAAVPAEFPTQPGQYALIIAENGIFSLS